MLIRNQRKTSLSWFCGSCDNIDMDAVVTRNPKVMHGAACFAGTRVTVRSLFDHLAAGYTVEGFLEQFPTVKRDQVMSLLDSLDDAIEHSAVLEST